VQTGLLESESVPGEGLSFGNRKATCEFDASDFLLYTVPVAGCRLEDPRAYLEV
jgi:hypothetical protein